MKATITETQKNEKELTITFTPAEMEKFLDTAASHLAVDMKIKGFRDGKVPRSVVESTQGKQAVWNEAAPHAVEEGYRAALKEHKIEPIGQPRVDILKLVPGNNFEFKAVVPTMPHVELPDYKSIAQRVREKETKEVNVEDGEVEDALKWLQKSRTPQTEESKESPSIDDAFAKSLGNFENLEALKKNIGEGIQQEKEQKEKERIRLRILEEIGKKLKLDIPDSLIEGELNKMHEEFTNQIQQMEMTLEDYLKKIGKSEKDLREGWGDKARERVMVGLILRLIAEHEEIEADDEKVETEANNYLKQFGSVGDAEKKIDPEALRTHIRGILKNEKVFQLLEEQ